MKILLAIDDSAFSQTATETLVAQLPKEDTEVLVLHVVEPISISVPPEMASGYYPELNDQAEKGQKLVEGAVQALQAAGFKATSRVEKGDPRSAILDQAAAWPADLIVLGSHGRRGLIRFLLGSVAEAVARHARCSVEIVRMPH
ncbi:MAG TPA: universal stress protein [Candidatus Dormibacteraeota bacterium]|nr:universal stress protein [Candidatus Dormibacteraeota bacterium]